MQVFFKPNDYRYYLDLLAHWSEQSSLKIWAYALMPNHVHIIAVPEHEDSLRLAMSQTHRRYTNMVNKREGWTGHLWEGRFKSYPIDNDPYLLSAVRYVELNPVHANMVQKAQEHEWSSARAHILKRPSSLLNNQPLREMISDWEDFLGQNEHLPILKTLSKHSGDSYF